MHTTHVGRSPRALRPRPASVGSLHVSSSHPRSHATVQWPRLPHSQPQSTSTANASSPNWRIPCTRLRERVHHLSGNAKHAPPSVRHPPRCTCHVCAASCPRVTAWPGAPTASQGPSAPLRLLVWLQQASPCFGQTADARNAFREACMQASVHALRCAKYEVRTTNCVPHMRLTTVRPLHARQCRAGLKLMQRFVRQHLGWHVALDTTQLGRPIPQTQRNRGFATYVDSFRFTHQRRPYGRPSHRSRATTTLPQLLRTVLLHC
jgi:hypothetical protein